MSEPTGPLKIFAGIMARIGQGNNRGEAATNNATAYSCVWTIWLKQLVRALHLVFDALGQFFDLLRFLDYIERQDILIRLVNVRFELD